MTSNNPETSDTPPPPRARVAGQHSAGDLSLTLAVGRIDPAQFHVLSTTGLGRGELDVELGLLGGSHYLLFQYGQQAVSEILSSLEVDGSLNLTRFDDFIGGQVVEGRPAGLEYRFQARRLDMESQEGQNELHRMRQQASQLAQKQGGLTLQATFPSSTSGEREGESILAGWIDSRDQITLEALHGYPGEDTLILTHTTITPHPPQT